jgi:hypothetical protein
MADNIEELMLQASAQQRYGATQNASDEEEEAEQKGRSLFYIEF